MPKLTIGHLRNPSTTPGVALVRCDRATALGNPFPMHLKTDSERLRVCNSFEEYASTARVWNSRFREEIEHICSLLIQGTDVQLLCHCFPKKCHTETIRKIVIENLPNGLVE